jgi:hypothetical protein
MWITLLAMADHDGRVWGSIPGLANRARVTVEEAEAALERFLAPDRYSRTPDHEGRRIKVIPGGWEVLNHAKYRALRDVEARREYQRTWDREHRAHPTQSDKSDKTRPGPTQSEAETEKKSKPMGDSVPQPEFEVAWKTLPRRSGNNPKADALRAWKARIREGVKPAVMIEGAQRYRHWCEGTGKIGAETVMRASTFFGRGRPFEQEFSLPSAPPRNGSPWAWARSQSEIKKRGAARGLTVPEGTLGWIQFRDEVYRLEGVTPEILRELAVDSPQGPIRHDRTRPAPSDSR